MLGDLGKRALGRVRQGFAPKRSMPGYTQFSFTDSSGRFDYRRYREVQNAANAAKIGWVWVEQDNVKAIAEYIRSRALRPQYGICHGTRRGLEQQWFSDALGCSVIGTEIGDSASQFANTVQHDFHETRPEWLSKADFIYSNSLDHAYDPGKALRAWVSCLRPGGLIFLEHTSGHEAPAANDVDPFGAALHIMPYLVLQWSGGDFFVTDILDLPKKGPGVGYVKALVIERRRADF